MSRMPEWRTVTLNDVLTAVKRPVTLAPEREYRALGVRWYGNGAFAKPAALGSTIAAKTLNEVRAGDVVYSKLFAWKGSFATVPPELDGVLASSEFPTYNADPDALLPEFFALWASRPEVAAEAELASTGTTANSRNRFATEDFLDLELALPDVALQQAIVACTSTVSRARAAASAVAACAKNVYAAAVEESVHGDERPLSAIVESFDSGESPKCLARPPEDSEWGVLKTSSVRHGAFDASQAKALPSEMTPRVSAELKPGDLVTIRASGSRHLVGALCLVPDDAPARLLMSDYHWRLRLAEDVHPAYLMHATYARSVRARIDDAIAGSTTAGKISQGRFLAVSVPVPPIAADQEKIAERLSALWRAVQVFERKEAALERLELALIEDLVTGVRQPPTSK